MGWNDRGSYGMSGDQRGALSDAAFRQLMGIYEEDPGTFWGQRIDDWTADFGLEGLFPEGGISWADLIGGAGGGGGGGGGGRGFVPSASLIDLEQEIYQLDPSARIQENVLGRGGEYLGAQTESAIRALRDRQAAMGMNAASPAALYMEAELERQRGSGLADLYRQFETDWYEQAAGRQHQARGQNAALGTQASIAGAANRTQASLANAARAAAMAQAAAARRSGASQFLLSLWDRNQDRDLSRYAQLHGMNQDWQRPFGSQQWSPSGLQQGLGYAGALANLYTQLGPVFGLPGYGGGQQQPVGGLGAYGGGYTAPSPDGSGYYVNWPSYPGGPGRQF